MMKVVPIDTKVVNAYPNLITTQPGLPTPIDTSNLPWESISRLLHRLELEASPQPVREQPTQAVADLPDLGEQGSTSDHNMWVNTDSVKVADRDILKQVPNLVAAETGINAVARRGGEHVAWEDLSPLLRRQG